MHVWRVPTESGVLAPPVAIMPRLRSLSLGVHCICPPLPRQLSGMTSLTSLRFDAVRCMLWDQENWEVGEGRADGAQGGEWQVGCEEGRGRGGTWMGVGCARDEPRDEKKLYMNPGLILTAPPNPRTLNPETQIFPKEGADNGVGVKENCVGPVFGTPRDQENQQVGSWVKEGAWEGGGGWRRRRRKIRSEHGYNDIS